MSFKTSKYARSSLPGLYRVVALIAYDLRPTESHICLALVPDELDGVRGYNELGHIFSQIHREAIIQAGQAILDHCWVEVLAAKLRELAMIGPRAFDYAIAGLIPKRINFYQFIPAELDFYDEPRAEFRRVSMDYRYNSFIGAHQFEQGSCHPMDRVPSYIKHARYIEGLTTPASQPSGVFYRRAAMSFGGTAS